MISLPLSIPDAPPVHFDDPDLEKAARQQRFLEGLRWSMLDPLYRIHDVMIPEFGPDRKYWQYCNGQVWMNPRALRGA